MNCQPRAYESPALPLSYVATAQFNSEHDGIIPDVGVPVKAETVVVLRAMHLLLGALHVRKLIHQIAERAFLLAARESGGEKDQRVLP